MRSPTTPLARLLRIFIAENHLDTLKYHSLCLTEMGHTVLSAWSIKGAMAELPTSESQVLISDIDLRDRDGWELLR